MPFTRVQELALAPARRWPRAAAQPPTTMLRNLPDGKFLRGFVKATKESEPHPRDFPCGRSAVGDLLSHKKRTNCPMNAPLRRSLPFPSGEGDLVKRIEAPSARSNEAVRLQTRPVYRPTAS